MLAEEPGVAGHKPACRVPTWVERAENNAVLNKIIELSENVSLDFQLVLVFEI